ncbi:MAG: leucyl/phenylalanyl-tRNA--protein transferase, partial [Pseudomonadota bacterium]
EVYMNGRLAGGLYGVAIGSAFFGESMFSLQRDASKIALVYLVARLRTGGFQLLDTQFVTDHLMSLGALEISRANYHARLARALPTPANYWALRPDAKPDQVLQAITQTS